MRVGRPAPADMALGCADDLLGRCSAERSNKLSAPGAASIPAWCAPRGDGRLKHRVI